MEGMREGGRKEIFIVYKSVMIRIVFFIFGNLI